MTAHGHVAAPAAGVPTVAFDLDGTLAHTAPDIVRALNVALVEAGLAAIPGVNGVELVAIGAGARKLVENALRTARHGVDPDPAQIEHLVERYLVHYLDAICVESTLFDSCSDMLDELRDRGYRLVVCTNKPERHARRLLEALEIAGRFDAVAGFDTYAFRKPDGRHIVAAIEAGGGSRQRAVMVGDSIVDVAAARDAGIPIVGVTFGYSETPIADLAPDRLIRHFRELVPAIDALLPSIAPIPSSA